MIAPRWKKVLRDVVARPGRSALTVLAMAAGIFQITTMLYKYALLQPELTSMYDRTHPSSATLFVDAADDSIVDVVRAVPGVGAAEARPVIVARVLVGEGQAAEWVPTVLYVVRDFDRQAMDTFEPEEGAWPPGDDEVLLERSALEVAKAGRGDRLTLRAGGDDESSARVAGTVHAEGLAPAWMEHMVPGFVGWTSKLRGGDNESAQIRIRVAEHPLDEGHIREVAAAARAALEARGHTVTRVTVPTPGKHPHADQRASFRCLLLAFGVLSFALSTVLAASTTQALMAEQTKQVGILKAIGGTDGQIARLYLGHVAFLSAVALAIGVPLGLLAGRAYAQFAAGILNADIVRDGFPWWVIGVAVAGGVGVPLLVALAPVRRAAGISVREALSDDPGSEPRRSGALERALAGASPPLSRPLVLSLRATLRQRGRLAVTIGMLALGGAAFLSAMNVSVAWVRGVEADFARRRYDLTVAFASSQPITTVDSILATVPGVVRGESWSAGSPYLVGANGVPGKAVTVLGLSPGSMLLALPLLSGRWLEEADALGAVVNQATVVQYGGKLAVGDTVRLKFEQGTVALPVRGIVRELAPMAMVYVQRAVVLDVAGLPADRSRSTRVVTERHDDATQRDVALRLEQALRDAGIEVTMVQRMQDAKKGILDHLVIILSILTMASLVVVVVGVLGLTSTLALGVVQRTRELGVLGAIGATPGTIARMVWTEALVLGAAGWVVAVVVSLPLSWLLESIVGTIFFRAPLVFQVSIEATAAWLGIALVLASIASLAPAQRAARLSVREALSQT